MNESKEELYIGIGNGYIAVYPQKYHKDEYDKYYDTIHVIKTSYFVLLSTLIQTEFWGLRIDGYYWHFNVNSVLAKHFVDRWKNLANNYIQMNVILRYLKPNKYYPYEDTIDKKIPIKKTHELPSKNTIKNITDNFDQFIEEVNLFIRKYGMTNIPKEMKFIVDNL